MTAQECLDKIIEQLSQRTFVLEVKCWLEQQDEGIYFIRCRCVDGTIIGRAISFIEITFAKSQALLIEYVVKSIVAEAIVP